MRGARDDVRVIERIGVEFGGDQTGNVGHVRQQDGVVWSANLAESFVIQRTRVGGKS